MGNTPDQRLCRSEQGQEERSLREEVPREVGPGPEMIRMENLPRPRCSHTIASFNPHNLNPMRGMLIAFKETLKASKVTYRKSHSKQGSESGSEPRSSDPGPCALSMDLARPTTSPFAESQAWEASRGAGGSRCLSPGGLPKAVPMLRFPGLSLCPRVRTEPGLTCAEPARAQVRPSTQSSPTGSLGARPDEGNFVLTLKSWTAEYILKMRSFANT